MTPEELAAKLNGREYRQEITDEEEKAAKAAGLVVLFGASDDLVEFVGAIEDEAGAWSRGDEAAELYLVDGKLFQEPDCECRWANDARQAALARGRTIKARYGECWTYETDIPHATFEIVEDGEPYCRGIVFRLEDAK